jgi:Tol biopolymer transport system component
MRVSARVAAVITALALVGVPASAAGSAFPGTNGRIAFSQSTGNGLTDSIFTVNPDGSGLKQLTSGHSDSFPRFSADAKSIVFTRFGFASSTGGTASHVMLIHSDGTGLIDLSTADVGTPFSDGDPSFSPDGKRIVFERDTSIYVANADGSGTATLLTSGSPPLDNANPAFSPDGTKIVFASTRATLNQSGPGGSQAEGLFTMSSTNGSNVTPVPGLAGNASFSNQAPDWGTGAAPSQQPPPPPPPPPSGCGSTNEPDHNGDLHSNCHTGAKGRGAGGNDKAKKRR